MHKLKLKCFWEVEHWRNGALLTRSKHKNAVTLLGLNSILDTMFGPAAQEAAWYLGLIDSAGFELVETADTMASHTGWVEFTDYSELTRPAWAPDAAANGIKINTLATDFNVTADGVLVGGFVGSDNTKGGSTGLLWGTSLFSEEMVVETNDIIKALYGIQAG